MAAPHLAIAIGKAQVQVDPVGRHGALQGDDLQIPLKDGGPGAAGALEGGPGEVPHHTQHKSGGALLDRQLLQAAAQVAAGAKLQRQGAHRRVQLGVQRGGVGSRL